MTWDSANHYWYLDIDNFNNGGFNFMLKATDSNGNVHHYNHNLDGDTQVHFNGTRYTLSEAIKPIWNTGNAWSYVSGVNTSDSYRIKVVPHTGDASKADFILERVEPVTRTALQYQAPGSSTWSDYTEGTAITALPNGGNYKFRAAWSDAPSKYYYYTYSSDITATGTYNMSAATTPAGSSLFPSYVTSVSFNVTDVTASGAKLNVTALNAPYDFSSNTKPSSVAFRSENDGWSDAGVPLVFSDGVWSADITATKTEFPFALKLNDGTYFGKSGGAASVGDWIEGMYAGNNINCRFSGLTVGSTYTVEVTADGENKAKARIVEKVDLPDNLYLSYWNGSSRVFITPAMTKDGSTYTATGITGPASGTWYFAIGESNSNSNANTKRLYPSPSEGESTKDMQPGDSKTTAFSVYTSGDEPSSWYITNNGTYTFVVNYAARTVTITRTDAVRDLQHVYLYKNDVADPVLDLKTGDWTDVFSVPCSDEFSIQAVYGDGSEWVRPASATVSSSLTGAALSVVGSQAAAKFTFGSAVGNAGISFTGNANSLKANFTATSRNYYLYIVTSGSACAKVGQFSAGRIEFNANNNGYYFISTLPNETALANHSGHRFGPSAGVTYQDAESADAGNVALPIGSSATSSVTYNDDHSWHFINGDVSKHSISLTVTDDQPTQAVVKNLPNYKWVIYAVAGTAPKIWPWSDSKTGGETYTTPDYWPGATMERYGDNTNLWMFTYSGDDNNPINRIKFNGDGEGTSYEVNPTANPMDGTSYNGYVFDLTQGNLDGDTDYHTLEAFMTPKIWGALGGNWSRAKLQMTETSAGSGIWKYSFTVTDGSKEVIWNIAYDGYDYQNTTDSDKLKPNGSSADGEDNTTYTSAQLSMSATGYASGHSWMVNPAWIRTGSNVDIYFNADTKQTYVVVETPKLNASYRIVDRNGISYGPLKYVSKKTIDGTRYLVYELAETMPVGSSDSDQSRQYYIKSTIGGVDKKWCFTDCGNYKFWQKPNVYKDLHEWPNADDHCYTYWIDGNDTQKVYTYVLVTEDGTPAKFVFSTTKQDISDVLPSDVGYRDLEVTPSIVFQANNNWDAWTTQPVVYVKAKYLNNDRCVPDWEMIPETKGDYTKFVLKDVALRGVMQDDGLNTKSDGKITILILDGKSSLGTTITLEPGDATAEGTPSSAGTIAGLSDRPRMQLGRSYDITLVKRDGTWYAKAVRTAEKGIPFIGMVGNNFQQKDNETTYNAQFLQEANNTSDGWQESWILYDASGRPMRDLYGTYIYSTQWPPKNTIYFNGVKGEENLELSSDNLIFNPTVDANGDAVIKTGAEWAADLQASTANSNGEYDGLDFNPDSGAYDPGNGKWGDHSGQRYIRYVINNSWLLGASKVWSGWGAVCKTWTQDGNTKHTAEWDLNMNWGYKEQWESDKGTQITAGETGWMVQNKGNFMFDKPAYFKTIEFFLPVNEDGSVCLENDDWDDYGKGISRAHFFATQSVGNATIRARAYNLAKPDAPAEANSGQMLARIDNNLFPEDAEVLSWSIRRYDAVKSEGNDPENWVPAGTAANSDPENNLVAQWFLNVPEGEENINSAASVDSNSGIHLYELSSNADSNSNGTNDYDEKGFVVGFDLDEPLDNGRYFYALTVTVGYSDGNNDTQWTETVQSNPFTIANFVAYNSVVKPYQLIKIHDGYDDAGQPLPLPSEFKAFNNTYISNKKVDDQYLLVYPADYGGSNATPEQVALRQTCRVLDKEESTPLYNFLRGQDKVTYTINGTQYVNDKAFGPRFYTWTSDYYVIAFESAMFNTAMEAARKANVIETYTEPAVYVGIVDSEDGVTAKTSANRAKLSSYNNGIYGRIVSTNGDLRAKRLQSNVSYSYLPVGAEVEKPGSGSAKGSAKPVVPRPFGVTTQLFQNVDPVDAHDISDEANRTFEVPSQLVSDKTFTFVVPQEEMAYREFKVKFMVHQPNVTDAILNNYRIDYHARLTNDYTILHYANADGSFTKVPGQDYYASKDLMDPKNPEYPLLSTDDPAFMLFEGYFYDIDQTQDADREVEGAMVGAGRYPYEFNLRYSTPRALVNPVFQILETVYRPLDDPSDPTTVVDDPTRYLVADYAYDKLEAVQRGGFEQGDTPPSLEGPDAGFWVQKSLNGSRNFDWTYFGHRGFEDPGDYMNTDGVDNNNKDNIEANFYLFEMALFEHGTQTGASSQLEHSGYIDENGKWVDVENYAAFPYAIRHNCNKHKCIMTDETGVDDIIIGKVVARQWVSNDKTKYSEGRVANAENVVLAYTPVYIYKHSHSTHDVEFVGVVPASELNENQPISAPRRSNSYGSDPDNPADYNFMALVGTPLVHGGVGQQLTFIEEIEAPQPVDSEAEYYNLLGIRVLRPEPGNVYIVRRGDKVTKEITIE